MRNSTKRKIWLGLTLLATINLVALDNIQTQTNIKIENNKQIENNLKDISNLANSMEIKEFNEKQKIKLVPSNIEKKDIVLEKNSNIELKKYTGSEIVLKPTK